MLGGRSVISPRCPSRRLTGVVQLGLAPVCVAEALAQALSDTADVGGVELIGLARPHPLTGALVPLDGLVSEEAVRLLAETAELRRAEDEAALAAIADVVGARWPVTGSVVSTDPLRTVLLSAERPRDWVAITSRRWDRWVCRRRGIRVVHATGLLRNR